jgi:nucleoporin POM34
MYQDRSPSGSPINGSPLAGRGVGNTNIWGTGSSPSGSPWIRKAVEGRRLSSGGRLPSGSPLSRELALDESLRVQSTPTPAGGSRASVQLNSKWLYQKRRSDSPGSRGVYT